LVKALSLYNGFQLSYTNCHLSQSLAVIALLIRPCGKLFYVQDNANSTLVVNFVVYRTVIYEGINVYGRILNLLNKSVVEEAPWLSHRGGFVTDHGEADGLGILRLASLGLHFE